MVTYCVNGVDQQTDERKWSGQGQPVNNLSLGLAGWCIFTAGYTFSVEIEESLIDQQLHTWAKVDSLLGPGREHLSAKGKATF